MRRYITKLKAPLNMRQAQCLRFRSTPRVGICIAALFAPWSICGRVLLREGVFFHTYAWTEIPSYINGLARRTFSFSSHSLITLFHLYICFCSFWIDSSLSFLWAGSLFFFIRLCLLSLLPFSVRTHQKVSVASPTQLFYRPRITPRLPVNHEILNRFIMHRSWHFRLCRRLGRTASRTGKGTSLTTLHSCH